MQYTTDFLPSQHANYRSIKDMMGFIVPVPLLNVMCWNRADLKVSLPVPGLVSSGCILPDRLLKLSMVPQKAGLVLSFRKDTYLWQLLSYSVKKAISERVLKPPEALAMHRQLLGNGNRSALCAGWNFLFQELQLALQASQRWLQWSPFFQTK